MADVVTLMGAICGRGGGGATGGKGAAVVHAVTLTNGCVISDERRRIDMGFVHACLEHAYWAQGRPRELTERSFANCLCFGIYMPDDSMVGFCRLLTDYTFMGHLGDVFIDPRARGMGLGTALVRTILGHPELRTVTLWTLKTKDAHGLYEKFGFRLTEADGRWMALDRTVSMDADVAHTREET